MTVDDAGKAEAQKAAREHSFQVSRAWFIVLSLIVGVTNLIAVAPLPAGAYPALHWIIFLGAIGVGIVMVTWKLWPMIWWPILTALFFFPAAESAFSRPMWTVLNVIEVVIVILMVVVAARSVAGDFDGEPS